MDIYLTKTSKTALTALKNHLEEKISMQEIVLERMTKEEHEQRGQQQLGYLKGLKESLANIKTLLPYE